MNIGMEAEIRSRQLGSVSAALLVMFALSFLAAGSAALLIEPPEQCDCAYNTTWDGTDFLDTKCEPRDCPYECYEMGDAPYIFCFCHFGNNVCRCWGRWDATSSPPVCNESQVAGCPTERPECKENDNPPLGVPSIHCECR